jgi:hypothetical protein
MWLVGEIGNATDKKTADSYLEAVRKADSFLNSASLPAELHEAGIREVLIHFAEKDGAGLRVMFALGDESAPRARSEFELLCALFAALKEEGRG